MSKRDLKKYLESLDKEQISEQFLDLYDKFPDVKTYYNFVFRPNEDKLVAEAKAKISNEYFPVKSRRAKLRRSTAQKFIKHFLMLGVDPFLIADVMLFNTETALKYTAKRQMRYESFYASLFKSFEQAVNYVIGSALTADFKSRIEAIVEETRRQHWPNRYDFSGLTDEKDWDR
jgi:hypothetical protein